MKQTTARFIASSVTASLLFFSLSTTSFAETTDTMLTPTVATEATTSNTTSSPGRAKQATQSTIKDKLMMERQTKKDEFKTKLATIKDMKKKSLAEKIDMRLTEVNQKRTAQMTQALTRMNNILLDLTAKSALAKEQGQDTTTLNTAITSAQAAVKLAETAVAAQVEKEYVATITSEAALKSTMGATVRTLQTELRATHTSVTSAKQKVMLAVKELAKLNGKSMDKDASNSAEEN